MTIHHRWSMKITSLITTILLTFAGLLCLAESAHSAPPSGAVAEYLFTAKPADGTTVPNTATGSAFGPALVQNPRDDLWGKEALTLTGGAKESNGSWVKLPENLLTNASAATIQMELTASNAMLSAFHFLWNIGNDRNEEYLFASLNCASNRHPLMGIRVASGEELIQSSGCPIQADTWSSVTITIDGDAGQGALFINGKEVARGSVPAGPKAIANQSLNTIARSPWPDPLFEGKVATFRVYDKVLSAAEIAQLSDGDATLHTQEIQAAAAATLEKIELPNEVTTSYIGLPTENGTITWTSDNPAVIEPNGKVNRPMAGQGAVAVTLHASATLRGITATRDFHLSVQPSDQTPEDYAAEVASSYAIPTVLRSGMTLPTVTDGTLSFAAGAGLQIDAQGVIRAQSTTDSTITATIDVRGVKVSKTFAVRVLAEADSQLLISYDRTPTSEMTANNADIAYSMHMALGSDGTTWQPLNENYGIFFARTNIAPANATDVDLKSHRSLRDPAMFYMKDGSYGIVAVRTNRGSDVRDPQTDNAILFASSKDLLSFDERANSRAIITVPETNGVNKPNAVYDSAADRYIVSWVDDSGVPKWTTYTSLSSRAESLPGPVHVGSIDMIGTVNATKIEDFRSGHIIAVEGSRVQPLMTRYGRITNTGMAPLADQSVRIGASSADIALPTSVTLTYSDGSTRQMPAIDWDTSKVNFNTPGTYEVTGKIKQTNYPLPFAEERADPTVREWIWKHNGIEEKKFLMIATNDIYGDNVWQRKHPHMPIRMADSIAALADTPGDPQGLIDKEGFNPKESILRKAGDKNTDGQPITGSFWAPEFHEINGTLSILFMPSYNSNWADGASAIMQLKKDANGDDMDPTKAESWTDPRTVTRADGSPLSQRIDGTTGMSLDMTYFTDAKGAGYYAWQQLGAVYIASVNPADPYHVTSDPMLIVSPEYAWDNAIAEGPNVIMRDGKLYMIYSGSTVGRTYTTGLAVADASGATNLLDPAAWKKLNYPIQKSGIFNGEWQLGTGHGMWSTDEDGQTMYVFHAYANKTEGYSNFSGRDTFVRRVHWAADGMPIFDMSLDEEVAPGTIPSFRVIVTDTSQPTPQPQPQPQPTPQPEPQPQPVPGADPQPQPAPTPGKESPVEPAQPTHPETPGSTLSHTGVAALPIALLAFSLLLAGAVMHGRARRHW
ncbi:family 43 glycosylhydrolase [Trueperella sp. LYQ143]|uniref:family 43 glycosylhydrolase n=1 Tax=Trueperella sp. LYQ143 TaxID=3391059 RepID=UPI003983BD3A